MKFDNAYNKDDAGDKNCAIYRRTGFETVSATLLSKQKSAVRPRTTSFCLMSVTLLRNSHGQFGHQKLFQCRHLLKYPTVK